MTTLSTDPSPRRRRDDEASLEEQIEKLKREVAFLRQMLQAEGVPTANIDTGWATQLSPAQRHLMSALIRAYPRWVQPWDLEAAIPTTKPGRDHSLNFARVLVSNIRRKLGSDAIESLYGVGYRASPAFIETLKAKAA